MFYNDHAPPHFHVRYGSEKAIVSIDSLAILEGHLRPRVHGFVVEWALLPKAELEDNWNRARREIPLEAIAPLE